MLQTIPRIVVDEKGDVELRVQGFNYLVSSSKMATLSPKFHEIFHLRRDFSIRCIDLPHEDPTAIRIICQSAHGTFIPQTHISSEALVAMTDIIRRYAIPRTSKVHTVVEFCFHVQAMKPEALSTTTLLRLLQVGRVLDIRKCRQLLEDVFFRRPLQYDALPLELCCNLQSTNCSVLLANILLKGASCRANVASLLLKAPKGVNYDRNRDMADWILRESASLQEIGSRLRSIQHTEERRTGELLEACGIITHATVEVCCYLRDSVNEITTGHSNSDVAAFDACANKKHCHTAPANGFTSYASSVSTEFEDIEKYCESVNEMYDEEVQFDDSCPLRSAKTI
ncbi:hypothetical protein IQ07DRAFT_660628 [Pyrenochaeta sp. DS3sAY3a]|nr:hypothetical protein IQ07DRAFT_660628 [Pyrenochaeta sp. DS3sAY3a]